jgi:hypothetical protein
MYAKPYTRRVSRLIIFCLLLLIGTVASAQCSICTKTAEQLGPDAAQGLNYGILYLALTPFLIVGFIGYRVWKRNKQID